MTDLSQVFLLRGLVEQQTASTMRYKLANTARERLDLANHYVHWGRVDKGEEMYNQAVEIDLNNRGLEYLSRLGLAKCSLAK